MARGINRAHYERIGRSLFNAGLLIFFAAPRSWQEKARQRGYEQARNEWRAAHASNADEWGDAAIRNREFCLQALKGGDQ